MTRLAEVTAPADRQRLPDALRALAMLSVLVMNAIGYTVAPWGHPLGVRTPADSVWAAASQGLAGALLQGKGYAMLAFVFGMALWLAARHRSRPLALQRGVQRHRRMLRLGMLHGVFIYFGDILTMYALVGRRLLPHLHDRWGRLRRRLWWSLAFAVVAKLVLMAIILTSRPLAEEELNASIANADGVLAFLQINAGAYVLGQVLGIVVAAPVLYFCMVAGVAAARLRLLTHRRWRAGLRRYLWVGGALLLPPTLLYGWVCATGDTAAASRPTIDALGDVIAVPVASLYVAALGLASAGGRARWCARLGPLGQRTLTLYVAHGVLCVALFSGIGLALTPTTAQVVLYCLALWTVAWWAATLSGHKRWPLEAWMARR